MDDDELLTLEIDTIHGLVPGPRGGVQRLAGTKIDAMFGWSPRAAVLAVTDHVAELIAPIEVTSREQFAPEVVPAVIRLLRRLVEQARPGMEVTVTGGPSFVFPDSPAAAPAVALPLIGSDAAGLVRARQLVRPSNWEPGEWGQLIAGEIGHWVMAVAGDEPVSICHTPGGAGGRCAEAGTWTRADHRGAGLATATARAWWALERPHRDVIFYSTSGDNHASRGVARKLGVLPLGWLWTLATATAQPR